MIIGSSENMSQNRRKEALEYIKETYSFDTLESLDTWHSGWGASVVLLTEKDLKTLLRGEPLWFDDGEYTHILIYEKSKYLEDQIERKRR